MTETTSVTSLAEGPPALCRVTCWLAPDWTSVSSKNREISCVTFAAILSILPLLRVGIRFEPGFPKQTDRHNRQRSQRGGARLGRGIAYEANRVPWVHEEADDLAVVVNSVDGGACRSRRV